MTGEGGEPAGGAGADPGYPRGVSRAACDAANTAFFRLIWIFDFLVLRIFFGLRVENAPRLRGPVILAPNHASFADPLVLQAGLWRRVIYLMTEVHWGAKGANWFFRFARTIPVRVRGLDNRDSLETALGALRRGAVVGIFPEGSRSRDGRLRQGRPGVAMLAIASGAPVVPVALIGSDRFLPVVAKFIRPARLRVRFGEPLRFAEKPGVSRRALYREATAAVMDSLARLLGEGPRT